MNSIIAQLACLLLFASMICNSLQLPSLDDDLKRTSHKLMRFGRTSAHNMMHFGKRGNSNESGEDADVLPVRPEDQAASVEPIDDKMLLRKSSDSPLMSAMTSNPETMNEAVRQARLTLPALLYGTSNGYLRARPRFYYDKKADNRDNVFMHFG